MPKVFVSVGMARDFSERPLAVCRYAGEAQALLTEYARLVCPGLAIRVRLRRIQMTTSDLGLVAYFWGLDAGLAGEEPCQECVPMGFRPTYRRGWSDGKAQAQTRKSLRPEEPQPTN